MRPRAGGVHAKVAPGSVRRVLCVRPGCVLIAAPSGGSIASTGTFHRPRVADSRPGTRDAGWASSNWSGYAVTGSGYNSVGRGVHPAIASASTRVSRRSSVTLCAKAHRGRALSFQVEARHGVVRTRRSALVLRLRQGALAHEPVPRGSRMDDNGAYRGGGWRRRADCSAAQVPQRRRKWSIPINGKPS
jgi:hypothetical protein